MVPYCQKAKEPILSLTHHRLCQLLINRGFQQQNHPLRNPAPAAEFPHEQQQQQPPDVPELPHALPTEPTSPVRPPIITESPPIIAESSTPAFHILSDDSEPEESAYPNTRGRPLRKRKQAFLFPPFLRKRRLRTSTRPPPMTPTLATPPIQLTPREPPTSPTPGSLPLSTMGAVTQELDAPQTATSSVSHKVTETQEPVTHSVAETQEPALAETQKTATAEIQEPAADIEMELQDLDAQISFVFNKEAETQSAIHPVAETQEPATIIEVELQELETLDAAVAETQEPATDLETEAVETQDAATPPPHMAERPIFHSMAETQDPPTEMTIDMQGSEAEGAEILLSLYQKAETQVSVSVPVAAPQEPATHIEVALQELQTLDAAMTVTQEPATGRETKEVKIQDAATPPLTTIRAKSPATDSVAETQKPPTDVEIDEILLSLHQEAETQTSVAAPQEPAKETMTVTQEPVITKSKSTTSDVLQENEFLKSQLEAYQQELDKAREAYEKELTRYALERTAILAERTPESICKEYMCCQCGNVYYQAGYKIVQVPVPGTVPTPSPFEVKPAVTQEPAGLRKSKIEPAVTQEPAGSSKIKEEAPTDVNKAVQTEEVTSPSQGTLSTSREQSTQTLPGPKTANAQTQTSHQWDEYKEIQRWKKEYAKGIC